VTRPQLSEAVPAAEGLEPTGHYTVMKPFLPVCALLVLGCSAQNRANADAASDSSGDASNTTDPVVVATTGGSPVVIRVIDDTISYTLDGGGVWRVPTAGGAPVELAATDIAARGLGIRDAELFWTDRTQVGYVPLMGGMPRQLATGMFPYGVVIDATYAYWSDLNAGTINRTPRAGGATNTLATIDVAMHGAITSLALDTTNVYWLTQGGSAGTGTVSTVPIGGGGVSVLASGLDAPGELVVHGDRLYWAGFHDNTVASMPTSGGTITVLASGQQDPAALAVDSSGVYWVNNGTSNHNYLDGTVNHVPLAGGAITVLAHDEAEPTGIALGNDGIYWTTYAGGTIRKLPRS
jgi:hypothetical protein